MLLMGVDSTLGQEPLVIVLACLLLLLLVCAILVNMLGWMVIRITHSLHFLLNYLVATLFLLNYLQTACCVTFALLNSLLLWQWSLGEGICMFWLGVEHLTQSLYAWFILAITLDRWVYFRHRHAYFTCTNKQKWIPLMAIWIPCATINILALVFLGTPTTSENGIPGSMNIKRCYLRQDVGFAAYWMMFSFILPIIPAIIMYIVLFIYVRKKLLFEVCAVSPTQSCSKLSHTTDACWDGNSDNEEVKEKSREERQRIEQNTLSKKWWEWAPQRLRRLTPLDHGMNLDIIDDLPFAEHSRFTLPRLDRTVRRTSCDGNPEVLAPRSSLDSQLLQSEHESLASMELPYENVEEVDRANNPTPLAADPDVMDCSTDARRESVQRKNSLTLWLKSITSQSGKMEESTPRRNSQNAWTNGKQFPTYGMTENVKPANQNMANNQELTNGDDCYSPDPQLLPNTTDLTPRDDTNTPAKSSLGFSRESERILSMQSAEDDGHFSGDINHKSYSTLKKLGTILIIYCICRLPFCIVYMISAMCDTCEISHTTYSFLQWLSYLNAAVNPLAYCVMSPPFRQSAKFILSRKNPNTEALDGDKNTPDNS